jgi:hypothetical protein
MKFEIKPTRCDCHPETCCCPDYTLFLDGKRLVRDSDKENLEQIVKIGETAIKHTKKACAEAVFMKYGTTNGPLTFTEIDRAIMQAEVK